MIFVQKDMRYGAIVPLIISFSLPMLLGNIFQQFYNLCDTIIVGKSLGKNALAAVGSTGSLHYIIMGFVTGLCSGFGIPVSTAFGKDDLSLIRKHLVSGLYLSILLSCLLTFICRCFLPFALTLTGTPSDIYSLAYTYIHIVFSGIIFLTLYHFSASILRALGDSKAPFIFLLIASLLNIALDLLFVLIFHLGVSGAAYATVIAQGIAGIASLLYLFWRYPQLRPSRDEFAFSYESCLQLLRAGLPMGLQVSITAIGSLILQTAVNQLGTNSVAAMTAYSKVECIVIQPVEAIGITMATFCSQNKGAGNMCRIRQGIRKALLLSLCCSFSATLIVCFWGSTLVKLFITASDTQVILLAKQAFLIEGLCYPLLSFLFLFRYALQGLGFNLLPLMGGVTEIMGRSLIVFAFVPMYHFTAACFASPVAWLFVDCLLLATYFIKIKRRFPYPDHLIHHAIHSNRLFIHEK